MSLAATAASTELHYKGYMDDVLWDRLVARIQKDHPEIDQAMAERIMDATICFLLLCGRFKHLVVDMSSALVDIGWHTFILYTREYAAWCMQHVGHFVHHSPNDLPDDASSKRCCGGHDTPRLTSESVDAVALMRVNNIVFDPDIWQANMPTTRNRSDCRRQCCGGC